MLIRAKFRIPDVFLGMMLAVAIFALGATFWSSQSPPGSPNSPAKTDNVSGHQEEEEGWWKRATDPLSVVTFLLVIVGGAQLGLFYRQLRLIRDSLTPAKDAALAARDSANAQRAEFLASHRPKIRVKHLWLTKDIWGKEEIEVSLGIVNNGTAEATLNTIGIRFVIIRTGRPIPFDPDIPDIPGVKVAGIKMPVGVWWKYTGIKNGTQLTDAENTELQKGESKLYCIGYVSYYDGARNMRITGFCRILESPTNFLVGMHNSRFRKFDDPDYEYED